MKIFEFYGRGATEGTAIGEAFVINDFIGAWGVLDPVNGIFTDERQPSFLGRSFTGKVLIFRGAIGSSGWSMAIHQARLNGTAPAALVCQFTTAKLALGAAVSRLPTVTDCDEKIFEVACDGDIIFVDASAGRIEVRKS